MVIIGIPKVIDDYYMADDDLAFELERAGFKTKYFDDGVHYFKKNNKLIKKLSDLGIEV